jgi:hypothetical protein
LPDERETKTAEAPTPAPAPEAPKIAEAAKTAEAPKAERTPVNCAYCGKEIGKAKSLEEANELAADHIRDCPQRPRSGPSTALIMIVLGAALLGFGIMLALNGSKKTVSTNGGK